MRFCWQNIRAVLGLKRIVIKISMFVGISIVGEMIALSLTVVVVPEISCSKAGMAMV